MLLQVLYDTGRFEFSLEEVDLFVVKLSQVERGLHALGHDVLDAGLVHGFLLDQLLFKGDALALFLGDDGLDLLLVELVLLVDRDHVVHAPSQRLVRLQQLTNQVFVVKNDLVFSVFVLLRLRDLDVTAVEIEGGLGHGGLHIFEFALDVSPSFRPCTSVVHGQGVPVEASGSRHALLLWQFQLLIVLLGHRLVVGLSVLLINRQMVVLLKPLHIYGQSLF